MKKIRSLVLAVALVLSLCAAALADEGRRTNENIFDPDAVIAALDITTYETDEDGAVLVVKNGSSFNIELEVYAAYYDAGDKLVCVDSDSARLIEQGYSAVLEVSSEVPFTRVEYGYRVEEADYAPMRAALAYTDAASTDAVTVSVTNNNAFPADKVTATVLFFAGDELVYADAESVSDDTDGLLAGATGEAEVECPVSFDSYEIYLSAYTTERAMKEYAAGGDDASAPAV